MSNDVATPTVVITGVGLLSPIGIGVDEFWGNLQSGTSGIDRVQLLSHIASPDSVAGEVSDFTESTAKKVHLKPVRKSIKVMCREIQLGVASALQAITHSGLDVDSLDHHRFGVGFGANLMSSPPEVLKDAAAQCTVEEGGRKEFEYARWAPDGINAMEPLWLLRYLPNMPGCHIGIAADARGPNNSITLDEASCNLAIAEAASVITRARADVMIAGTTGTRMHPVKAAHAVLWDTIAAEPAEPARRCRPFELNRTGQVVGEGAGSFILETEAHAQARGATIYGRVLSTAATCVNTLDDGPKPDVALERAMRMALERAGLEPQDIGHISAQASGSRNMDRLEAEAIHRVFGDYAAEVPVTALKSYVGNAGSGCGPLELAGSLLGLQQGVVPHTLNYETPDPACQLNVVRDEPLAVSNKTFLKVNVTRMGQASAVVISV